MVNIEQRVCPDLKTTLMLNFLQTRLMSPALIPAIRVSPPVVLSPPPIPHHSCLCLLFLVHFLLVSKLVYRIPCNCGQVYIGETRCRLEMRLKEHRDACERGMIEKSAAVEHAWENESPLDPPGGDHSAGQRQKTGAVGEGGSTHPDDTVRRALQPRWRTGSPQLLDYCDLEAGREEQSSPTFDLQRRVSSATFTPLHWSIELKRWQVIFRAQVGTPCSSFMHKEHSMSIKTKKKLTLLDLDETWFLHSAC